ncbi:BtpA/SgcQ family protein [candidate division KSB1 bacterium]|nr:BtpA/SgcQ family protein [candidate division KSB1 bacterium]
MISFKEKKPVIGVVHLKPLPGSPLYRGDYDSIVKNALTDTRVLVMNGIDGLIIENYGDVPFYIDRVPPETIACMSVAATKIIQEHPSIPVGINVLRNDARAALAIAKACGGQFIRTNVHVGVTTSEQGLIVGKAHHILRYRRHLESQCQIFADIYVKHSYPLVQPSFFDTICDTLDRGLADGLIVTGSRTGQQPDLAFLKDVYQITMDKKKPLFLGSGVNIQNVESLLPFADGVIVGTFLKFDGKTINSVDPQRVQQLMDKVRHMRENL